MTVLGEHQRDILKTVSPATVTTLLLKQGIRRSRRPVLDTGIQGLKH